MPESAPPPEDLAGLSLQEIARLAQERRLPPVDQWNPAFCGHSGMRIAADGGWFHEGTPVERPAMVRLFASLLRAEDEGYRLVTPVEKLAIDVDDLPFLAVEAASEGEGPDRRLAFRLTTGDLVVAGPTHRLDWSGERPALQVRGGLLARIARPVHYELAELALADAGDPVGLWSDGCFFAMAA